MKAISEEIHARLKNPLFGYFLFASGAINWDPIFYLIVDNGPVTNRIAYFHAGTDFFSLVVYPSLATFTYLTFYPWISYLFINLTIKPIELRDSIQDASEHKLLIKRQELEVTRSEILKAAEAELIDRAKRDADLSGIESKEVRVKVRNEIDELRREGDEKRNRKSAYLSREEELVIRLITSNGGTMTKDAIIADSKFHRVKTLYLLEMLETNGYLSQHHNLSVNDDVYDLTTKSKKIMVDKGIAK